MTDNINADFISCFLIVGMSRQVSTLYHFHPSFTIFDQPQLKCFPCGIFGSINNHISFEFDNSTAFCNC